MNGIYLIIGGNLANRIAAINNCKKAIQQRIGTILRSSSIYETAAWGKQDQANFLNQVIYLQSNKTAQEILQICLAIEHDMGRIRNAKWEERIIDIDILFFNNEIIHEKNLKIPHPHLQYRRFVLVPLHEIAAKYIHPILKKSIADLLAACDDVLDVKKYDT